MEKTNRLHINIRTVLFSIAALILLAAAFFVGTADGSAVKRQLVTRGYTVPVVLAETSFLDVEGDRALRVTPGSDVTYKVSIPDGYTLDVLGGGAVWNGSDTLTLEGVFFPTTVRVRVRPLEYRKVKVWCENFCGELNLDYTGDSVLEGTEVYIRVTPCDGYDFLGFSLGAPISEGGEVLTGRTRLKYVIHEDTEIFTNFYVGNAFVLNYDANGGTISDGRTSKTVYFSNDFYLCPNAAINDGTFVRSGWSLVGFNTAADGSGDYYGCGWNVIMPENGIINLYAVWLPETDARYFTVKTTSGGVEITGCNATGDTVVVPEKINGKDVISIAKGGLKNLGMTTLVLPRTLLKLNDGAIDSCKKLTMMYMSDSVMAMRDSAFNNCSNLSTYRLLAQREPVWTNNKHGTYSIKFEQLYTAKTPKLVIVAGSNTAYGLDSVQLMKEMTETYTPVNFGFNWKSPSVLFIEAASRFIDDDDIVLLAPELDMGQWGSCAAYGTMWQLLETCYEVISYIDVRNYTGILSTFASYNNTSASMTPYGYEFFVANVNEWGDYTIFRGPKPDNYAAAPRGRDFSISTYLADTNVARLNAALDMAAATGARIWMTYPPINRNSLTTESLNAAYRTEFDNAVRKKLHVTIISDIHAYIFPGNYYYDSDYHLSTVATEKRTSMLAADLNRMFAAAKDKGATK